MPYVISLLDKGPVAPKGTAAEALQPSIAFAKAAGRLGYHRLWLAEHHGVPQRASSAPDILAAHLLAVTKRIRIGTGGVLLQHYSPYKGAEVFGTLAPGRVDLGIGKAPGGMLHGTRAPQSEHGTRRDFVTKLQELTHFLRGTLPADHPLNSALVQPQGVVQRFFWAPRRTAPPWLRGWVGASPMPGITTAIPGRSPALLRPLGASPRWLWRPSSR
jgi:luciferase family oxidoreductase group 1